MDAIFMQVNYYCFFFFFGGGYTFSEDICLLLDVACHAVIYFRLKQLILPSIQSIVRVCDRTRAGHKFASEYEFKPGSLLHTTIFIMALQRVMKEGEKPQYAKKYN